MERESLTPILPFKLAENRMSSRPAVLVRPTGTLVSAGVPAKKPKAAALDASLLKGPALARK